MTTTALVVPPRPHPFSDKSRHSVHLAKPFAPGDFTLGSGSQSTQVTVRAMELITDLVTKEIHLTLPAIDGKVSSDVGQDLLKIAAIDRRTGQAKTFVGLVKGFGLKSGALASSAAWDTSDIIVVGANDHDMALAVNRIHALQGGYAFCDNGRMVAEVPMPIWGLISDLPITELVTRISTLEKGLGRPRCFVSGSVIDHYHTHRCGHTLFQNMRRRLRKPEKRYDPWLLRLRGSHIFLLRRNLIHHDKTDIDTSIKSGPTTATAMAEKMDGCHTPVCFAGIDHVGYIWHGSGRHHWKSTVQSASLYWLHLSAWCFCTPAATCSTMCLTLKKVSTETSIPSAVPSFGAGLRLLRPCGQG